MNIEYNDKSRIGIACEGCRIVNNIMEDEAFFECYVCGKPQYNRHALMENNNEK